MIGQRPNMYFRLCWKYISPGIIGVSMTSLSLFHCAGSQLLKWICNHRSWIAARATSQLLKLRFNCDSFVLPQFMSFHSVFHPFHGLMNSINWPASSVWVFIAQVVEQCSANVEATASNPAKPRKLFLRATSHLIQLRWSHIHFICIPTVHIISFCSQFFFAVYLYSAFAVPIIKIPFLVKFITVSDQKNLRA